MDMSVRTDRENRITKAEIRRKALARRSSMSEEERKGASLRMTDRILGHQWFYRSGKLLLFVGFGTEIDTTELITEALRMGKMVFLPRVEGAQMQFFRIFSMQDLQAGYRGIPEPDGTTEMYRYEEDACGDTFMIMPGVAFDEKPGLAEHTIAIGFQCQMVDEIPTDEFDCRPYQVLLF